jgi:phosphoribosyl-ATP pyrophosphohydrolase
MAKRLKEEVGDLELTIAGGVKAPEEVAALHDLGIDAQVGMALYTGRFDEADCIAAMMKTDRTDALVPTLVVDEHGVALGLAYSDGESLREAIRTRRGVYRSRSRGLWVKGQSSGATQRLLRVDLDCDSDTLRFMVRQLAPGFCHKGTRTCWGDDTGVTRLARRIVKRAGTAPEGSYTARLLRDSDLLGAKIREEADELARATDPLDVRHEAADVLYFLLTKLAASEVSWADVERELDRRSLKVTRRPGDAKPREDAT